ncbi:signal recognition particle-docking protein FtsY [Aphanothece hegewaldii CCALA 016]|uniref:Signal recognition particle receptor FtsY n=1 Tax=Aphanothece hegewaldii CCALA 016 TaxID=2107694 RepID=A0A2T1LWQ6_9CHRO|nr:signal recognition particle-docking protein FtsY [Aphanothece hegewaldii]PSF36231.1 signal recognition particle-docking protein FtsY [Aphanothece hegewaldii CCALA 016]
MFNWFRRQHSSSNQPQEQEQEQQPTVEDSIVETQTETVESVSETTETNTLNWAKTAFKNIQQRKSQNTTEVNPPEEEIKEAVEETVTASGPAWMQKSKRLEELKETAIVSPTDEPETTTQTDDTLDEEFVWSANVLAKQGRKAEDVSEEEINWLKRLRQGLGKTRRSLVNQLKSIVGQGPLNQDAVSDIESILLQADVGVEATDQIIDALQTKLRQEALPSNQALEYLKEIVREILDRPLKDVEDVSFEPEKGKLNIWLLTGVNGVGKTTTIGKLAHLAQKSGYSCVIAAADTFRAAAVEQVKVWGDRSGTEVIANPGKNTDPAAVVFDGIAAAQARNIELLLVDTAGRLQNKKNLMDELTKIRRIVDKKASNAHVESLLVLDATLGQNGLRQAQVFAEAAQLSGVVLTKLDGTAKGGVALAVVQELNLPIRFIGAGEGIEDLRPFSSYEFVEALLNG